MSEELTGPEFPKTLYRDGSEFVWDGRPTDTFTVESAEEQEIAEGEGWQEAADYAATGTPAEPTLLDKSAKDIEPELAALSIAELEKLKDDETAGKSRRGVLALIEAALEAKLAA